MIIGASIASAWAFPAAASVGERSSTLRERVVSVSDRRGVPDFTPPGLESLRRMADAGRLLERQREEMGKAVQEIHDARSERDETEDHARDATVRFLSEMANSNRRLIDALETQRREQLKSDQDADRLNRRTLFWARIAAWAGLIAIMATALVVLL